MLQAVVFGVIASSALLLGAVAGVLWRPPERLLAFLVAFASGALLAALAFELFGAAEDMAGLGVAAAALLGGATVFIAIDWALERYVHGGEAAGLALVAAVTVDGIPENLALGVTLAGGGSVALLVAIVAANFPEALQGTISMRDGERGRRHALLAWSAAAVLLAVAVVVGRLALQGAGDATLAALFAFAAGAVLASLADKLMPIAYAEGGPLVGFGTAAGFLLGYALGGH